jgi:hypothetical protein
MPASLYLDEFGSVVWDVFGSPPYLVGSCLTKKTGWRDVDVRMILDDAEYEWWGLGEPAEGNANHNEKWVGLVRAFSELGQRMTGLPIDFQIQQQSYANRLYGSPKHPRSALGLVPHRWARYADNVPTVTFTERRRRPSRSRATPPYRSTRGWSTSARSR